MNKRRRYKAKRRRYLKKPKCLAAFKAVRYMGLWGGGSLTIERVVNRDHKVGLSLAEIRRELEMFRGARLKLKKLSEKYYKND